MWSYLKAVPLGSDSLMRVELSWMKLVPLLKKKKIPDSSLAPATMQKHNKKMSMSRTQTLNSNEFAGTFILDFSASRNYKKYISVAYKTRVYGILL